MRKRVGLALLLLLAIVLLGVTLWRDQEPPAVPRLTGQARPVASELRTSDRAMDAVTPQAFPPESPQRAETVEPRPTATVAGDSKVTVVVIDAQTRESIPDAVVFLSGRFPSIWSAVENSPNTYLMQPGAIDDPEVLVTCNAPGYMGCETRLADRSRLPDGRPSDVVTIELARAESQVARLRAVDAVSGKPLPNVRIVRVSRSSVGRPPDAVTGSDGVALVPLDGKTGIRVLMRDGYLPKRFSVTTTAFDLGDLPLFADTVTATLTVTVPGVTVEDDGWLMIGRISPSIESTEFAAMIGGLNLRELEGVSRLRALTNRNSSTEGLWHTRGGHWRGQWLLPGDYMVVATFPEHGVAVERIRLTSGERDLVLDLRPGAVVKARLPVPDSALGAVLVPDDEEGLGSFEFQNWAVRNVPRGFYRVDILYEGGGRIRTPERVHVPLAGEVLVQIPEAGQKVTVTGRLLEEVEGGEPVPLAGVQVGVLKGALVLTDADGAFTLEGVPPGDHRVRVPGFELAYGSRSLIKVPSGATEGVEFGDIVVTKGPVKVE